MSKPGSRIPFEELTEVDSWSLPSIDDDANIVPSAEREDQLKGRHRRESIEEVSGRVKVKPLTAEELKQITDEAEKEGFQQGYETGLNKGLKDGMERGEKQGESKAYEEKKAALEEETTRLCTIADALFAPMQEQDEAIENTLVDVIIQLTRHLIAEELTSDPQKCQVVVHQAVAALPVGAKNICVYLHPEDVRALQSLSNTQHEWRLVEDETLDRGSCRVETAESLVNFSLEKRINEFLQAHDSMGDDRAEQLDNQDETGADAE